MVQFVEPDGTEKVAAAGRVGGVRFEDCLPVREIPSYAGQRHTPGLYWAASCDRMVAYESWLEAKWLKLTDFAADTAVLASQPFRLHGADSDGRWEHVPDLFVRRTDGSVKIIDVKAVRFSGDLMVVRQRDRTAVVCEDLGWDYEMVSEPDSLTWATVDWLAGYRRPLRAGTELVEPMLAVAARPVAIGDLASFQSFPELARSVVYHLMWTGQLTFDITKPLRDTTLVKAADTKAGN
ncbi:TnsA-like heteromeric transposase endonuclease subunit [Kitasatospora sp. NPDC028055]|uniref:TnsA-like heteromeric transposase endonuclease subunit n=1 Tax=Kitasatospora sp. NPDC028055 TaxID=3155653 RepID=UPI0033D2374B